ncbi:hypothetical protein [Streptomyces sp. HB2AG]|uniref:hypothetical protein n=1 Tax=Streptomyces sp. HB2AG TaxID=2983400 RepID=UPI0022AA587C|nr:hypothetical protein [Streptomyces sp. HB2AG]MCZ2526922.1 hypothetical protein [Streptomyces sp. HB2AG]
MESGRPVAVLVTAVVGGTLQGVVVGRWQWRILRRRVPELRRRRWVVATLVPALLVWLLVVAPGAADVVAEGGDALGAFRDGFAQAVVLGPLIGVAQAVALRDDTSRWAWWFAANVTTYLAGAAVYASGARLLRALSLPGWIAPYLPVLVFAFHGVWMLWVTAPGAVRRAARSPDVPRG